MKLAAWILLFYFLCSIDFSSTVCPEFCKTCSTDQCSQCNDGYFLESATSCKPCSQISDTCSKCSPTDRTCLQCDNSFLNKVDATCVSECPSPSTYTFGTKAQNGECHPCSLKISSCAECSADGTACTKCIANKFLRLSDKKCYQECQPSIEFSQGDAALQTGVCESCTNSDIKNCLKCASKSSCQECSVGYFSNNPTSINACLLCSSALPGCDECTYSNSKPKCSKCASGYYLDDTTLTCVKCGSKCLSCNKDRCLQCEDTLYPLSPLYKACSPCNDPAKQTILSRNLGNFLVDICSYYPEISKSRSETSFLKYRDSHSIRFNNSCSEPADVSLSSNLRVYWACGKSNDTLNNLIIDNIKSKVLTNTSFFVSNPDYADGEGKFFGSSDNGTILCPGMNGGAYFLVYFCENKEGLVSPRSPDNAIIYTLPFKERDDSALIVVSSRYSHSTKINNFLCCFEDIMGIAYKRLFLTEQNEFCIRTSTNKRRLTLSYGLIFRITQDQYNISESNDLTKSVEDKLSKGNLTQVLTTCNESVDSFMDINIMRSSSGNVSLLPSFEKTKDIKFTAGETNVSFSLKITNINAIIWIGYAKNSIGIASPLTIDSLKTDLENAFPLAATKGADISIILTNLVESSDYTIYFSAEDFFNNNATSIFVANFKTLTAKFSSTLSLALVWVVLIYFCLLIL